MKHQLNEKNGKGNSPKALNKVTHNNQRLKEERKKDKKKQRHMNKKYGGEKETDKQANNDAPE